MNSEKIVLKELLNLYLKKESSYDFSNVNLKQIYEKSCGQGIGTIVAYTILKYKLDNNNSDYLNDVFKATYKSEQLNNYREKIKNTLEKNKIDFIFLKGNSLSKYYEEEYLRISSDIDIIVKIGTFEITKEILIKELGFIFDYETANEASLHFKQIKIDLHKMFTQTDSLKEKAFSLVEYNNNHELSNEYKYLYSMYHAYKHIDKYYLSIKFVFDLYYLRSLDLDLNFISTKISEMNLNKFNDLTNKLLNYLFCNQELSEDVERYYNYLYETNIDLGVKNMTLVFHAKNKNKSVLLKRIFPDAQELYRQYPKMKNRKILLPIYYVKRIVDRISQGKFKQAKKEISNNININKEKVLETQKLLKDLGI